MQKLQKLIIYLELHGAALFAPLNQKAPLGAKRQLFLREAILGLHGCCVGQALVLALPLSSFARFISSKWVVSQDRTLEEQWTPTCQICCQAYNLRDYRAPGHQTPKLEAIL